jgi:hypothetical protein
VRGGLWRAIFGWFLIVVGILWILAGAIAIAASYDPSTPDAGSTRLGGAIFVGVGLVFAVPGILLIRSWRRVGRTEPRAAKPHRGWTKAHWIGAGGAAILVAAGGVGAIIYSFSIDADVQAFLTAHKCAALEDRNCYQLRNIVITGVDISHNGSAESDTVRFTDSGSSHEVDIHPGRLDSSVLRTGAEGEAILWRGNYTNVHVAGVAFATTDNPAGQRNEWRLIGFIALAFAAFEAAVFTAGFVYVRRRKALRAALLPRSAAETTGYPILPLVLHPSVRSIQFVVWLLLLPMGLAIGFFYLDQFGRAAQWTIGAASALLVAWGAIWQFVLVPRSGIYVDELSFGTISGLGRRKSYARGDAAHVALKSLYRGRRAPAIPLAIVVGPDGRARMRFSALLYAEDALTQFAAALRVPLDMDSLEPPITPTQLEKEIPGSMSWAFRHATALGGGIAIVGGAVILLAIELSSGPSQR